MTTPLKILGIAGSLRKGSYNRAALRAAVELALEGTVVEPFDLDGIPPFNQDDDQHPPARRRAEAQGARGRRHSLRHAGVQLQHSGRAQKRD